MVEFKSMVIKAAQDKPKRLVLPEAYDPRVVVAAGLIKREKFVTQLFLLGEEDRILSIARENGVDLKGIEILNPLKSEYFENFVEKFYEMRKAKGLTIEEAKNLISDEVYFGAMMVKEDMVDGMVSGSMSPTAKTVRAALIIVKPMKGINTVSGSFVMVVPDCSYGYNGMFVYADCGVVPEPSSEQLADIAIVSAGTCRELLGIEPYVALLSFSTLGSADSPSVRKIREAVEILRKRKVDFFFDGEIQFDAAVDSFVAKTKAPNSVIGGKANVMIFPDLNSGNIGYKITQRLAKAEAYGPILQGLSKPVNDLSRGATPEDILVVSAITVLQVK